MSRIRVAVGDVHSAMLRDVLARLTALEVDMDVVEPTGAASLQQTAIEQHADVVVCDVEDDQLPQVCRALFTADPPPVVVGLVRDGRDALVCIANPGAAQLMNVMRSAIAGASERPPLDAPSTDLLH